MNPPSRPAWLKHELYPFQDRWLDIDGNRVHYLDEGRGPALLLLHGNPTWSFLYRHIVAALVDSYRCVAVDYPGFGLSTARQGYGFTPREHSQAVEQLVHALDLGDLAMMVQDWGGPIGLGFAERAPDRVRAFVIGNAWAWPLNGKPRFERFSALMGGPIGRTAIRNFNAFVNLILPVGTARSLRHEEMRAYRGPFPTRASRTPTAIFPRQLMAARAYLADVEVNLPRLSRKPALIVWGARTTLRFGSQSASASRRSSRPPHRGAGKGEIFHSGGRAGADRERDSRIRSLTHTQKQPRETPPCSIRNRADRDGQPIEPRSAHSPACWSRPCTTSARDCDGCNCWVARGAS